MMDDRAVTVGQEAAPTPTDLGPSSAPATGVAPVRLPGCDLPPPAPAARFRLSRLLVAGSAIATTGLVVGFALFVSRIETVEVAPTRPADGIVALTGGADRVDDALELLARGHGRRLLITGVNPSTNRDEVARLRPGLRTTVACCVDLGYRALNTIGNAQEAAGWARAHAIRSLIVVTSNYHMPRAMAEMAHELPDVDLQAYPVVAERARHTPWWADAQRTRLLVWEYVKYLLTEARLVVVERQGGGTATGA